MSKSPTIAKRTTQEFDSRSITPEPEPEIHMPADGEFKRPESVITKLSGIDVTPDYLDTLAFFEGGVKVIFHESGVQFAAPWVECSNNGTGFELLHDGKWLKVGQVPVNEEVIVKRKYLDTLGRARETALRTEVVNRPNEDPINRLTRSTMQKYPFSVVDHMTDHKRSIAWLTELMSGR